MIPEAQGIKVEKTRLFPKKKNKAFPQKVSKFFGDSKIIRTFVPLEPAKPLNDAQMCGSFYFYTMSYSKNKILIRRS